MSVQQPFRDVHNLSATMTGAQLDDIGPYIGDRHFLLLEAGINHCCPDGDLLSLMPSVERPDLPWVDGKTWLRRILGF
jgi:hypothetical protein